MFSSKKIKKQTCKRPQKKENGDQNQEKEETFICICGKQYLSFPALYLHNKKQHGLMIKLEDKNKMNRKIKWSGSKKKIIYELEQLYDPQALESPFQNKIKRSKPHQQATQKRHALKQITVESHYNTIDSVLGIYQQSQIKCIIREEEKLFTAQIVKQLKNCLNLEYSKIFQTQEKFVDFTHQNSSSYLPLTFNYFVVKYITRKRNYNEDSLKQVQKVLLDFSKWLYQQKLSPYLAAQNK